jgi:hypothetical protein
VEPLTGRDGHHPLVIGEHHEKFIQQIKKTYMRGLPCMIGKILEFIQERSPERVHKTGLSLVATRAAHQVLPRSVNEDHRLAITTEAVLDDFQRVTENIDSVCHSSFLMQMK